MEIERLSVATDHVCSSSSSKVEWWVSLKVCVLEFSCRWIIISDWKSVTKIYSIVECAKYRPFCPWTSLVGWAKQAEWLVPGMFHNIMVFRICTSGFIQWACVDYTMGICGFCTRVCGFWTMVRYGRWPKKMCPLCHVRGLNRGRKSDMKTIMLKTKSNPQKTEVSKMCWRNNLRTNFHNKFSSLKTGLSNEVHILLMSTRTTKVKWKCQCTNHPLPEKILFHNRLCLPENYCKNVSRLSQIQHPICSKVILARLIILLNFKLAQC
jgi:hypothetical protein